jgi:chemotaxis family two-component system response regulator PixG
MMTIDKKPPLIPISEFVASKQIGLFQTLKQPRFSGQLILGGPKGDEWTFYLYLGRIMYATGGHHSVRRWRRNLEAYLPQLSSDIITLQRDLASIPVKEFSVCWEYELLCLWVDQQKISREQVARMIRAVIIEVFFDVTQAVQVTYQIKRDNSLSTQLVLIDAEQVIADSWKLWQAWQGAKVADRSPNSAPVIRQPEQLQGKTTEKTYQVLTRLLDGQRTLRDLSFIMKKNLVDITRSLMPYVQLGFVELITIADLPPPISINSSDSEQNQSEAPLIACVDDSPMICQTMEQVLTNAGYRFVGVNDPLRAIAVLLARKPDLIFLDLVMPNANGYEICGQLRKLGFFRHTPIVILTGNDGIIDRMRAKMVGSTDFIGKPIEADVVLGVIRKHLKENAISA